MAEYETFPLDNEFAAYRADLLDQVVPVGPQAVRSTVQRRRRIAVTTTAVLALALIAGPVVGYAAVNGGQTTPPTPANSTDPTPAPTPSTSPSPSVTSTPAAPDGRITNAELLKAKVDLPPWQADAPDFCTTSGVRLGDPKQSAPSLMALTYGDADGDGALESIAVVGCRPGEGYLQQVVVFDRDAAGRIVTLGQVNRTGKGLFDKITEVEPGSPGSVRVQVSDIQPCCGTPAYWARKQWRTYGWNGSRFMQIDGPTEWGPDTRLTDLAMTGKLVLDPDDGSGKRRGSVTLTVTNNGPINVPQLGFQYMETVGTPDGGDWSLCRKTQSARGPEQPSCMVAGLRAGERRTFTFKFVVNDPVPIGPLGQVPAMGVRVDHYDAQGRIWSDLTSQNNYVELRKGG